MASPPSLMSTLFITLLFITSNVPKAQATLSLLGNMHQLEDFGYKAPVADENGQREEFVEVVGQLPFYRDAIDRSSYIMTESRPAGDDSRDDSRDAHPSTLIHAPLIMSNPFFNLARSIFRRSQRK